MAMLLYEQFINTQINLCPNKQLLSTQAYQSFLSYFLLPTQNIHNGAYGNTLLTYIDKLKFKTSVNH